MSDDDGLCHLPHCHRPLATLTLCDVHARILLRPRPVERPDPEYVRECREAA